MKTSETNNNKEIPEITGRYLVSNGRPSVEVVCPFCDQKHYHGWSDKVMKYPDWRLSHCGWPYKVRNKGIYYIKEIIKNDDPK